MSSLLTGIHDKSPVLSALSVQGGNANGTVGGSAPTGAQEADRLREAHDSAKATYTRQQARLDKATKDFEAVFVGMMLKQMRKSMAGTNALFDNSSTSKTYQEMLDDNVAQRISHSGGIGLAKILYQKMSKTLPPNPDATPETVASKSAQSNISESRAAKSDTVKTETVIKR